MLRQTGSVPNPPRQTQYSPTSINPFQYICVQVGRECTADIGRNALLFFKIHPP